MDVEPWDACFSWRIIRRSFSQERMTFVPSNGSSDGSRVVYESMGGKTSKAIDALDLVSQLTTHIPKLTYDDSYSQLLLSDYWLQ